MRRDRRRTSKIDSEKHIRLPNCTQHPSPSERQMSDVRMGRGRSVSRESNEVHNKFYYKIYFRIFRIGIKMCQNVVAENAENALRKSTLIKIFGIHSIIEIPD